VPVSWWILIARLVHGERLVGHTQFWLARPYGWRRLLTAKLLFLAVFLYLPFLVAQMLLLAEAGFNPFAYIPGLLFNLLSITGVLVLPLLALSAVTSGFGRMTLVLLGVILFIVAVSLLFSLRPADATAGIPSLISGYLYFLVIVFGSAAAVVVQYARRHLRTAWLSLAGIAAAFILLALIDPDQSLMSRSYAADSDAPPVQLAYAAEALRQPVTYGTNDRRELEIAIPLHTSGVRDNTAVIPVALKAVLDGPNGAHWESPWQGARFEYFLPGASDSTARFRIRRSVYEQFKASPVSVRIVFALDKAVLVNYATIPVSRTPFSVPGAGICVPQMNWFEDTTEITGIDCRTAMRHPDLTYVTAHWSLDKCDADSKSSASLIGTGWVGSLDTEPADLGITSVWDTQVPLSNYWMGYPPRARRLCPGTPLTFARFARAGQTQVTLTIPNFRLPELSLAGQMRIRVGE
jgi:hypothetical protein